MAFKCDIPPPPSKYSYSELGISLCNDVVSDDEEDNWLVTAVADYDLNEDCASNSNDEQNESTKCSLSSASINYSNHYVTCHEPGSSFPIRYTCQEWLENIEEKYLTNKDDLVRQSFQASFDNVADPYSFLLHVMYKAFFDLYSKRTPITYYALDEMNVWLDLKKNKGDFVPMPADFQKKSALEFVYQKGYSYFNIVTKIFQLDNEDNAFLAEVVKLENLTCKKFKEAVIIVQTLHLQSCFTAEQIMLPLLAFDQMQVLEGYINEDKDLQKDYVNLLNKLCAMSDEERHDYLCIDKSLVIKDELKLQHKVLTKVGEKAVKHYNLNSEDYPEIFRAKNLAGLNYLINMRWKEENGDPIAIQKWDNMIETAVAGKVWLQQKLVEKYLDYNDLKSAMYWVHKVFLPPTYLPVTLLNEMKDYVEFYNDLYSSPVQSLTGDQEVSETVLNDKENWEEEVESSPIIEFSLSSGFLSAEKAKSLEDKFYKLKLPLKDVLLVDTVLGLQEAEKILFKPGQVIGFDAEWKPTFGRAGEQDRVSILQLAVNDKIFIVDMLKLYVTDSAENVLREFFSKFFTSKHVVKIGYGIVGDLKILIGMFAYMKDFILGASNLVDLHEISDKVLKHAVTIPYLYPAQNSTLSDKGLSLLINRLLGKSLDKTFQVSDWDKRPLTREQICYAALDAYCLLEVFSILKRIVSETQIKVNLVENVKMKWLKPVMVPIQRKDKYEKRKEQQKISFQKITPIIKGMPRPTSTLKVICDTMLEELGKQLRKCGIDTLIASSCNNSKIIQIAHQDSRVILTCGEPYFMIRDHVPEGKCLSVQEGPLKEQVKMVFAKYNIALRSEDIFTRCPNCNTNEFVIVNSEEMNVAFKLKHNICDSKTLKVDAGSNLINLSNFTLSNNVEIQMDAITESCLSFMKRRSYEEFFRNIDFFKICCSCGEVYWRNEHDDVLRNEYRDVIDKSEADKSFYGRPG